MADQPVLEAQALPAFTIQTQPTQLPEIPSTISTALAPIMTDDKASIEIEYAAHLSASDRARAIKAAVDLYRAVAPDMTRVTDLSQLITIDGAAMKPLDDVVKYQLTQVQPVSLPQLKELMRGFQRQMAAIKGGYDISDPKVKSEYDKWLTGKKGFIFKVRDFLAALKADIQSIEAQIDKIERDLANARVEIMKNVVIYDKVFTTNEQGIQNLMYTIAVMELFVDYVGKQTPPATKPDGSAMTAHDIDTWKQTQAQLIMIVRTKIANSKGRLGIAWATSPQARMSQMTDIALAAQLDNLRNQAIPLARLTILTMRTAMHSYQNAQMGQEVGKLVNNMAQQYASLHEQTVTAVAQFAAQPIYWPETIRFLSDCLDKAADGIVAGYEAGEARHAEIDASLVDQQKILSGATEKVSAATRERVMAIATKKLPLELSTVAVPILGQ